MSVDKQLEQLLAGPLEGLASFSSSTTAEGQPHLHSARLLRLLLDRLHQVHLQTARDPPLQHRACECTHSLSGLGSLGHISKTWASSNSICWSYNYASFLTESFSQHCVIAVQGHQ